ncbi:MAG: GSU2403 family nucleotidyltransferase fold protein [Spirochaetota bacterium]|nr:GSU2403 family nucleotidyltransferase fold protein [Spirochaetota bacterium]
MHQNDNVELFEFILKDFDDNGILGDFILIGSWVLRVYSYHFENDPQIPLVATQDLDLLVTNPPEVSREVDIPKLLRKYDLEEEHSFLDGFSKFVSPDFEVEFLYPDKGRGNPKGKIIKSFSIIATPLRYMSFIQDNSMQMEYKQFSLRVPMPTVFVIMKYLLVKKRKPGDMDKITKDISTAKELEFFLLENGKQDDFICYFKKMPKKWQRDLLKILKENVSELVEVFKDII